MNMVGFINPVVYQNFFNKYNPRSDDLGSAHTAKTDSKVELIEIFSKVVDNKIVQILADVEGRISCQVKEGGKPIPIFFKGDP